MNSEARECKHNKLEVSYIKQDWAMGISKDSVGNNVCMGRNYLCYDCGKTFEIHLMYETGREK